jgi:hypothetical protein
MFKPATPIGGYAGWKLFERTIVRQREAFANSASIKRDIAYFKEKVAKVETPADLIADRRLLSVALGAFGLESEIGKKAIIRRVMEEGTLDPKSFANRLNDPRWKAFAKAFSFGDLIPPAFDASFFRDDIAVRFRERAFEAAVGDSNQSFRLAMNFKREIKAIAEGQNVDKVGWLQIMGQRPLRAVVEAALGLPQSIGALDIDRQRAIFEEKAAQVFGSESARLFLDEDNVETAIRRFLTSEAAATGDGASVRGSAALAMLSGGGAATASLLASNAVVR